MAKGFRELIGVQPSQGSVKDSVLIIIDAQNEYATGHLKTENVSSTRKQISNLLEKYRAAPSPVVHVVHDTPSGAPVFTPDTELAEIFSELSPREGEKVIHKQYPGSFTGTDLQEFLQSTGKNQIVLTGYMAHVCVSTTTRQAAEKGYDVIVAEGAVGDRDIPGARAEDVVKMVLAELGDAFATVVSADSIN
ncbi:Isochorismatase-like protein [Amylocarpus encephaloides]|uniref:Isochorismatase-like protein n=1 Tax=Amylocarpus encephaloides TaxID=45428 RepID=A0A9P7YE57_9HELO|nr:Isochorismatase-like protein [Amylocarpus encephaloides]